MRNLAVVKEVENRMECLKEIYKDRKSIFVNNVDDILNDNEYINRYDEWVLKRIGIGYLMTAIKGNEEIEEKLTEADIDYLIYTIACTMNSMPASEAIEESDKYDLSV